MALYAAEFHRTHDELLLIAVVAKLDVAPIGQSKHKAMVLIADPVNDHCNFQGGAFILDGADYKNCIFLAQLPVASHQSFMVEVFDRMIVKLCREPIRD